MIGFDDISAELERCFAAQVQATADWHVTEQDDAADVAEGPELGNLAGLVLAQHLMNFKLWHVEDIARRKDVGPEVIADCKYRIDRLNQRRNDFMEKVDACIVGLVTPMLPPLPADGSGVRHNTESLGMSVDRLSILSLKIFHMHEQTERTDADEAHRESCRAKLAVLHEQRADLARAVLELLDDYRSGSKRPKVYFQFKMYNDPSLNPQLYKGGQAR